MQTPKLHSHCTGYGSCFAFLSIKKMIIKLLYLSTLMFIEQTFYHIKILYSSCKRIYVKVVDRNKTKITKKVSTINTNTFLTLLKAKQINPRYWYKYFIYHYERQQTNCTPVHFLDTLLHWDSSSGHLWGTSWNSENSLKAWKNIQGSRHNKQQKQQVSFY